MSQWELGRPRREEAQNNSHFNLQEEELSC